MKWNIDISLEISHGRHRIFSLRKLIPLFQRWHKEHKLRVKSCFAKSRFKTEQGALNAEWFKKHDVEHRAYLCEVCDGWHITTKV